MKIIVTGCFGFIGYNFINYLLNNFSNDIFIVGIDSLETNCSKLNAKNMQTNDAKEGIEAFIKKRNPNWTV